MRLPLIAAALALAAPASAQTAAHPYRAQGKDWSLAIDGKDMRITLPGKPPRIEPMPQPVFEYDARRYLTRDVLVNAAPYPCTDGKSRAVWPDTVFLRVGGFAHNGCGGIPVTSPARAAALQGAWRITALHGMRLSTISPSTITFKGDRATGHASCSDFATRFHFVQGRVHLDPVAGDHPFCDKRVQNVQQSNILMFLATPLTASAIGGRLVLANDRAETMLLER